MRRSEPVSALRVPKFIFLAIMLVIISVVSLFPSGVSEGIDKGNAAYKDGKLDAALSAYDEAAVKDPESPYVYFNKGAAFFKMEDYENAKSAFRNAVSKTRDITLEAKANYNLGACSYFSGTKQIESDLKKAVELIQEAIAYWTRALEQDKSLTDAAKNIETARIVLKDLLDKLKKQEEQNKDKKDRLREIVEKIRKLIEHEERIINYTGILSEEKTNKGMSETLAGSIRKLKGEQVQVRSETGNVIGELDEVARSMQQGPQAGPIATAKEHLGNGVNFGELAENQLGKQALPEARQSEEGMRDELVKALESLGKPQDNQQQQDEQKKEEEQKAQASEAKDILDEEKENKKEREMRAPAGYSSPDKDW